MSIRRLTLGVVPSFVGVVVLVVCAYVGLVALGGSSRASAAVSGPAFLGKVSFKEIPGEDSESLAYRLEGMAVDNNTGNVYVASEARVIEFSAYGAFVLEFGKEVDGTQVAKRESQVSKGETVTVTPEQEDVCTAASGDSCGGGNESGGAAGQLNSAEGVAVEQSTGDVYVVDSAHDRVEKFSANGQFILTFGGEVNKTAVEESATRSTEENVCPGAGHPADVCQGGKEGGGVGQFEEWRKHDAAFIAVGGPSGLVYVGDKGRIQEFDSAGEQQKEVSTASLSSTGRINALAVDSAGNVYFSDENVAGVQELEAGGTLTTTSFASTSTGAAIEAIALDAAGHIFVSDASPSFRVLEYELASPSEPPAELATSEPGLVERVSDGLAVNGSGAVYVDAVLPNTSEGLVMFGSLPALEAKYGAPPQAAPVLVSRSASGTAGVGSATFSAVVNPEFLQATYQFEYGLQPCSLGGCAKAPASPATVGEQVKGPVSVSATAEGLLLGRVYYYRARVVSAGGSAVSEEGFFTIGEGLLAGAAGLPDGRVYEQVTPSNRLSHPVNSAGDAEANGEGLLFAGGAIGEADAGYEGLPLVSRHGADGWATEVASPRPLSGITTAGTSPVSVFASADLSRFAFTADNGVYSEEEPKAKPTGSPESFEHSVGVYETAGAASEPPLWLGKPTSTAAIPAPGHVEEGAYRMVGGSPDLSTAYFLYGGTLVPEDAARAPHTAANGNPQHDQPWGFYEWNLSRGLVSAGVLPDGSVSAWGAVPAEIAGDGPNQRVPQGFEGVEPVDTGNEVVAAGARALFVSPDPLASSVTNTRECKEKPPCTSEAPQVYLRVTTASGGKESVLVSRSDLPGHVGEPAQHGALGVDSAALQGPQNKGFGSLDTGYGYASSDGSRVFFQSVDRLTEAAPENSVAKEYVFDVATGEVQYVPGVAGPIVAASADGSQVLFENRAASPVELDLWSAEGGGSVTRVAQLPAPVSVEPYRGHLNVEGRATADGSVFVFATDAPVPAGFDNGGGYSEVYRYETGTGSLVCVSCAPSGVAPAGNAEISHDDQAGAGEGSGFWLGADTRVISADGDRVFFDTPTPLVPAAANGRRDVYEWEDGKVYLISSGTSSRDAFYMDSSESGDDVFFKTTADLSGSDVSETYGVYDARVPRPGEAVAASVACEGSACHPRGSSSSSPTSLSAPPSATFTGLGNLAPAPVSETKTVVKTKTKAKVKQKKKKHKKKKARKKGSKGKVKGSKRAKKSDRGAK